MHEQWLLLATLMVNYATGLVLSPEIYTSTRDGGRSKFTTLGSSRNCIVYDIITFILLGKVRLSKS